MLTDFSICSEGGSQINDFSQPYPTYAPLDCGPAPAIFTETKVRTVTIYHTFSNYPGSN